MEHPQDPIIIVQYMLEKKSLHSNWRRRGTNNCSNTIETIKYLFLSLSSSLIGRIVSLLVLSYYYYPFHCCLPSDTRGGSSSCCWLDLYIILLRFSLFSLWVLLLLSRRACLNWKLSLLLLLRIDNIRAESSSHWMIEKHPKKIPKINPPCNGLRKMDQIMPII